MIRILTIALLAVTAILPTAAQLSDSTTGGSAEARGENKDTPGYHWASQGQSLGTNSANYSGDTTGGPEWVRPFADGTCCSGLGPVTYDTEIFYVREAGLYDISSVQTGYDGYLFIYGETFDPLNQTAGFIAGDDDGNGGIGTSDIEGVMLEADTVYTIVTTGFELGQEGPYTNTISGPGAIVIGSVPVTIPTLGEWGLIAFMTLLAGVAVVYSRKSRTQAV